MIRLITILVSINLLGACQSVNSFKVARIVDGNSLELSNGVIIDLEGVKEFDQNIMILERYVKGNVELFDGENQEITNLNKSRISAIVYNSDGDCINDLLAKVSMITESPIPPVNDDLDEVKKTVVSMQLENGVYIIPVHVNEILMNFIFDTGASLISISEKEAQELYLQGKLEERDFVGKGQFSDANGDVSEGLIINLKTVKLGNRILRDVLACVVSNQNAPLLFGQSALAKFGKVSIDYTRNEIVFE